MNSTGEQGDGVRGMFSLDSTVPETASRGFAAFRREWEAQFGGRFRMPAFSPATTGDFRVKSRGTKMSDVAIIALHGVSAVQAAGYSHCVEDLVRMHVVRRGALTLGEIHDRGERTVSAGQFLLRPFKLAPRYEIARHTTVKFLFLPSAMLAPLLRDRIITGPTDSAEMRLLLAHTNMVQATVSDLGPAGVRIARDTVIELVKAVALRRFDDVEPLLAPALAQAAKDLADTCLTEPDLSMTMLARELAVSVRTLQRAFAATGESVTAYIRRRRLEEARLALTAPSGSLGISELAARWQFADSSHFIRTFKKQYGLTPTDYARSTGPGAHRRDA
ncbi:helix-turn-helix domain-containing protein [Umezawaea endophytica]|uniref:Helix-turn-helix domain-containing protein n=1 Tax=Umezawaea endophytica TaxID=1654476 RepID=A0A9X2VLN1_9PSEU|nr:helix-turn-helix domain-containing protein [Umezawaea endophytica]MCS7478714.1 helix-turn-helix domain-containing protein [Umezawaea endophytica]